MGFLRCFFNLAVLIVASVLLQACGTPPGPLSLSYTDPSPSYTKSVPINQNIAVNYGGIISSFTISPALPDGLTFDPNSGNITGTPSSFSKAGTVTYTVTGTNSGGSITATLPITILNSWDWILGGDLVAQTGVYGTLGQAAAANTPGSRAYSASWTDVNGNLWMFGGSLTAGTADANDLWKFDGEAWAWEGGSNSANQAGVYGTLGNATSSNVPGARDSAAYWTDSDGNFWLFGGNGYDSTGSSMMYLNDLWKFNGTNWVWVSGSKLGNQSGVYGTKGTANAANIPGGRLNAASWVDPQGNFWLFGGTTSAGAMNDLWKFDGTNWTWVSGNNTPSALGVYGTMGLTTAGNFPGARSSMVSWTDEIGDLWLMGGNGADSASASNAPLNDLWMFDGTNWTWISGSDLHNQLSVYGTVNTPSSTNYPGARYGAASWVDTAGNVWLLGGYGYDTASAGLLNDLWKFDGTNWTWVSGANAVGQAGAYGLQDIASATYSPGGRYGMAYWIDNGGNLWLFSGNGLDSAGASGFLNDLWQFSSVE